MDVAMNENDRTQLKKIFKYNIPDSHKSQPIRNPLPYKKPTPKIGRNDSCPCGSQKKFKKCCLGK